MTGIRTGLSLLVRRWHLMDYKASVNFVMEALLRLIGATYMGNIQLSIIQVWVYLCVSVHVHVTMIYMSLLIYGVCVCVCVFIIKINTSRFSFWTPHSDTCPQFTLFTHMGMYVCVCVCVFSQRSSIGDIRGFYSRQLGIHFTPGICPFVQSG